MGRVTRRDQPTPRDGARNRHVDRCHILADSGPDQPHHPPLQRLGARHARQLETECMGRIVRFVPWLHGWHWVQGRADSGASAPEARIKMAHHPFSHLSSVGRDPSRPYIKAFRSCI
jgi:hypothetical protein